MDYLSDQIFLSIIYLEMQKHYNQIMIKWNRLMLLIQIMIDMISIMFSAVHLRVCIDDWSSRQQT